MSVVVAACTVVAGIVAGIVWLRYRFVVVTVAGHSMAPTFEPGDRVLARRARLGRVRAGDIVVVGPAGRTPAALPPPGHGHPWIIKRAVAVPGDRVPRERVPALAAVAEATVPPGKLVLLGDGPHSSDSRQVGYFDGARLVGRAVYRLPRR
ncbi:S26 family signal peptidase [Dactylosporangium sp. NPDC000555]|uniref:S26 family signal peptidase n=1 Tax=Dactylosporangium sp. NPDC000555 TaxID=3154260 RepID=UPI003320F33C